MQNKVKALGRRKKNYKTGCLVGCPSPLWWFSTMV